MTGIEPTAIAGVAAKAIGKAVEEDPKEKEQLRKIAESTGALEPAAKTLAKRIALKQHIRLKLWQPLAGLFGVSSAYFAADFENELADGLRDVPEEDVVTPPLNVAGPVVQGIAFTVDEPNLRSMYINLLATASDRRVQAAAHPSFAQIIQQLGGLEAGWLGSVLYSSREPIVEIRREATHPDNAGQKGFITLATNVLEWLDADGQPVSKPEYAMFVDNWQRLGLVNVDFGSQLLKPDAYSWVESNALYKAFQAEFDTETEKVVSYEKGILKATDLGHQFFTVVIAGRATKAIEAKPSPS